MIDDPEHKELVITLRKELDRLIAESGASPGKMPQLLSAKLGCQMHRFVEAGGIGDGVPGDVEGGAVIDRSADNGQAEGDVDAGFERKGLERDETLVVIHADVGIDRFTDGGEEGGVGGKGADELEALCGGGIDGGLNDR